MNFIIGRGENIVGKGDSIFKNYPKMDKFMKVSTGKEFTHDPELNSLPNNKILDWSKLKAVADNKISMGKCNTILSAYTLYRHLG